MPWTNEQQDAISFEGNLIVSAAAGSGKTAVLTERIVTRIENGTPVDNILVLTFTRAAAAEMKTRIMNRLNRAADAAGGEQAAYLRTQATHVGSAYFSTVHAFCARVIKRHYHAIGLPPHMRIADELEVAVLREQVKETLLNALCAEENADWLRLLSALGSEDAAWTAVTETASFLESQPEPEAWLAQAVGRYESDEEITVQLDTVLADCKQELSILISGLSSIRDTLPPGMGCVIAVLDDDLLRCRGLLLAEGYDHYRQGLQDFNFSTLRFPRGTSDEEKAPVKATRETVKKHIREQQDRLRRCFIDEIIAMRNSGIVLFALQHIITAYRAAFSDAKRKKGVLDYADLEHDALSILSLPEIAREYHEKFAYIAIDEYQDSNRVHNAIIERIRRADNLFFVGDVKQSIYRFRQADPALFLDKLSAFSGGAGRRIDLNRNFRSAREVLDCVNGTFSVIMTEQTGEMEYDARAMLVPGATHASGGAELHIIERTANVEDEEGEPLEAAADAEVEARLIAERIRAIMSHECIDDSAESAPRAPTYADFAILLRSTTHAQRLAQTLSQCGIPCYAQVNGGYFDAIEVQVLLNLLMVIDNRQQDVPLLSVMLSSIGDFTPEELLTIRAACKDGSFFDALSAAAGADSALEPALPEKIRSFFAMLAHYRQESSLLSVEQLIGMLLDETGFYEEMGASYGGAQRQANLDALLARAHAFEATGARGVWSFLRHMQLARSGASVGAAQTLNANVVRILTIHKSKGLEYPYVFVAQLGARFNFSKSSPALQLHASAGIGLRLLSGSVSHDTALRQSIARHLRTEQLSEEMRVLYVAMTRAKSRLLLIGCLQNADEKCGAMSVPASPLTISTASSPLSWLLMGSRTSLPLTIHARRDYLAAELPNHMPTLPPPDEGYLAQLQDRFAWIYPHADAVQLPSKVSVSRISGQISGAPARLPDFDTPAFLQGDCHSGAFFGTAMHAVLQHLPLSAPLTTSCATSLLDSLQAHSLITMEQAKSIQPATLVWFTHSPLFSRLQKSPRVERELSFGYEMAAADIFNTTANERVLLQGVIDCCFVENNGWILLDYKTDHVPADNTPAEIAARHAGQLRLYATALHALTGMPVVEQWIVLLSAEEAMQLR
ncbi:MAG: UvrD-helicase domain-containing protein [Clostridia bacterium]